ncbi:hypothetical protein PY793_04320 [Acetobacter fabarum]|uniref:hypothetical protein n=1 Tax=Acetobacter fabarum TaxID=483199 RepID=UPI00312B5559
MNTLVSVVPRHPETLRDASGKLIGKGPVDVDPRDPFWRRLIRWGDVEVQKPATTSATTPAVATATASQNGSKP